MRRPDGFPWLTLVIAATACSVSTSSTTSAWLVYDRASLAAGQFWRAWTAHVVHFGAGHLLWNLAVFVPVGVWLERLWSDWTRWFYFAGPPGISAGLFLLDPALGRYGGLSGLAMGMLVLLAALQLSRRPREPAWFWLGVLVLVAGKIGWEIVTGHTLLAGFLEVQTVPLAHGAGVFCGALFAGVAIRRRNRAGPQGASGAG